MTRDSSAAPTPRARLLLATLTLLLSGSAGTPSCPGAEPRCLVGPAGEVIAFSVGEAGSLAYRGRVVEIEPPTSFGIVHHVVEEESGKRHRIAFKSTSGAELPVAPERTYDFELEYVPGEPSPSAITVRDEAGLLFAAVSDFAPGKRVLRDGLPGFEIAFEPARCASRSDPPCYESITNLGVRLTRGDDSVVLFQGETATFGGFHVMVLAAREIEYSDRCADAGDFGIAYVISRVD